MEVKKTFVVGGVKHYRGDPAPDVDKVTTEHYLRHGMIGPADKPAEPKSGKKVKPEETKPAAPQETK